MLLKVCAKVIAINKHVSVDPSVELAGQRWGTQWRPTSLQLLFEVAYETAFNLQRKKSINI